MVVEREVQEGRGEEGGTTKRWTKREETIGNKMEYREDRTSGEKEGKEEDGSTGGSRGAATGWVVEIVCYPDILVNEERG